MSLTCSIMASLALLSLMAHAAPIPVTICPVLQTGRTGHAQHAAFGVEYWANEVPALNVTVRFIGTYEAGSSTLRGVVGAFVLQSAGCDAIVGPGISDMATALNPVVNQMWVEYQASTTDFSNRINYPYFNRVNPDVSVTQSFFGQVLQRFGWTHINMFCVSTSYGRSVAGVVSAALGTDSAVYNSQCVANNIDYNTTRSLIQTMKASPSRVIFFAFSTTDPVAKNVYQVVKDLNLTQTNILLWSDSNCAGGGTAWAFPGSYCAANDVNNTRYNAFFAQYSQRGARYSSSIAALGFPSSQIDYNSSKGNQQAYAADAARVALHALDYYYASNTVPTSKALANAAAAVRAVRIPDGLSGDVYLPNGDRLYNTLRLYSAGSDGSILVAGEQSATGVISLESQQFAMGDWHAVDAMPYDVAPPAPAPPAYWAIGVALGGVLIIGVFAAFKLRTYLHLRARPTDGTKGFAVMFVAVKNEADVRDQGQAAAAAMLGHIRAVVKSAARRTECFEARRVDDATVMLVAKRAESAVECAAIITQKLEATNWNPMLATRNEGTTPLPSKRLRRTHSNSQSRAMPPTPTDKDTTPTSRDGTSTHARSNDGRKSRTSSTPSEPSHPLINIGIHYGFGVIDHDLDTDHVSYHGAVVTRAASVADAASQRQVLVSRAVVDAIEEAAVVMPGKFVHVDAEAKTDPAESEPSGTAANGSATSNTVFLYIPHDLSSLYEDFVLRPKTQKLEHGAIAAALATADAGLARRRVVLLSIAVPELMTLAASNRVQDISDLIADVTSLATEHRGAVLSIAGPQIVVGINCAGPVVSQAACRAAALATRLVETLGRDRVTIGIAASCAVASAGACVGSASAVAEAVRLCAAAAGVSIAAACSTFQDLDSKFQLLTIDHICLPQLTGCTRVYAVLQEIVATDEWLYAMNKSSHACINEDAWDKVIQLIGSQDDVTAVSAEIHHEIGTIHHNLNPEAGELVFSTVKASMVRLQSIADEVVSVPRPTVTPTPHYIWMRRLDALTRPWRNAE